MSRHDQITAIRVTPDNFRQAESDMYFAAGVEEAGGVGIMQHRREPVHIDAQTVIRLNRDTLYSSGVFDLDAAPVTVALPDAGDRFMSLMVLDEEQYVHEVAYDSRPRTYGREQIGTRYALIAVRTLADPRDAADLDAAHRLQDAIRVEQAAAGTFETPLWDAESQAKVRKALLALAETVPDSRRTFGTREQVDPVRHLTGTAMGWGGNPETEALYLGVVPARNDGLTIYRLRVKDVPVDGFWSVSVYNADGYFEPNAQDAYSLNSITTEKDADGAVCIQFGGCADGVANWLPITPGWNYLVRLYRPRPEVLDGSWTFPEAAPID